MPWKQTDPMFERARFIDAHISGMYSVSELCTRFGVSRKTGYKWLSRFGEAGAQALIDRSRRPHNSPLRTPEHLQAMIVAERKRHEDWGPWKIVSVLARRHPEVAWPAPSTAADILQRHGLVARRRRRRSYDHPGAPVLEAAEPNDVWSADFKGEFLLGNARYCYPLTVTDAASRYLLACDGFPSPGLTRTRYSFERLFHVYGLPKAIRTDNGRPFATQAIHGLSRLNVYWIKLGIQHQRTRPGKPQDNGRHERMHRTLKKATTLPPEATFEAQQKRFDAFRHSFNDERPHQALGQTTPGSHYVSSSRTMPQRIPKPDYPPHAEVRLIKTCGRFKFRSHELFLSSALAGERVALEEIDNGLWNICFYTQLIARLDERSLTIIP